MLINLCGVFFVSLSTFQLLCLPNAAALAGVAAPMHRKKMVWKWMLLSGLSGLFSWVFCFLCNFIFDFCFCNPVFKMSCFLFSTLPVSLATTGPSWTPWMVADVAKGTWSNLKGTHLPQYWLINSSSMSWDIGNK